MHTYIHTYTTLHTYIHTYITYITYIHTDRHTYIHAYIHAYVRTYRQTDRRAGRQAGIHTYTQSMKATSPPALHFSGRHARPGRPSEESRARCAVRGLRGLPRRGLLSCQPVNRPEGRAIRCQPEPVRPRLHPTRGPMIRKTRKSAS